MKDKTSNVKAIDGTLGGDLDPGGKKKTDATNDDDKPTRDNHLRSQKRSDLVKECKDSIDSLKDYEADRTSVNDDMNAIRSRLQAKGISKKALSMAIQISKMEEDELDGLWLSLDILSEAINRPIQKDLFRPKGEKAA